MLIEPSPDDWISLATACGIGLLIGLERERRKTFGPGSEPAGIRTFLSASLLGFAALRAGNASVLAATLVGVALLLAAARSGRTRERRGLTTELALLLATVLGALAVTSPAISLAVGVLMTLVLTHRSSIHAFVNRTITETELRDGLLFATASLVILPWLPDRFVGPGLALNPRAVWSFVTLLMAIGMLSHVVLRVLPPTLGLLVAGFASGFASSVAVVGAMAALARRSPELARAAAGGAALSCLSSVIQLAMILTVLSPSTLAAMAPALLGAGTALLLYAAVTGASALAQRAEAGSARNERAFDLRRAFVLGLVVCVTTLISAQLQREFGSAGLTAGAALAGIADVHAAAAAMAALVASGQLASADAVMPILAAVSVNAVYKVIVAAVSGDGRFAMRVGAGLLLQLIGMGLAIAL